MNRGRATNRGDGVYAENIDRPFVDWLRDVSDRDGNFLTQSEYTAKEAMTVRTASKVLYDYVQPDAIYKYTYTYTCIYINTVLLLKNCPAKKSN